jgi:AraC-like DNA-binding protein
MMDFRHHRPGPPLAEFVELLWLCDVDPQPWTQERLLPGGSVELVVDVASGARKAVVSGPHSRFFLLDTSERRCLAGVHFKAGGAFAFLAPPLHELVDAVVPLDALWGGVAGELRERLGDADTDRERFAIMESILLAQGRNRLHRHPAVAFALREFSRVPCVRSVAQVAGQVGLSQRRFTQCFTHEVGLTPKLFCRVRRFQAAIRQVHRTGCTDWSALAVDCGYFDQAHFIHDFQTFSGLTPSAWAAQRIASINHVPVRD